MQYGPFVMNTKDEIQKTLVDCKYHHSGMVSLCSVIDYRRRTDRLGQNGFEKAHVWKSKIGNH